VSILMTHVCQYTGPGCLPVLLRDHGRVYCHDQSFVEAIVAKNYEIAHPGAVALRAQTPQELVAELATREAAIETVIHNDVHPNTPLLIEQIPLDMFQESLSALLLFPIELSQRLLPAMKAT